MDNPRPEKVAVVDEVRRRLSEAEAAVLTEYRGLNVSAMARLRRELREAGGDIKVYKNTLVRFAARDLDLELEDLLVGPTAIAFTGRAADGTTGDPVTLAKALRKYATENDRLVIKGGLLGRQRLTDQQVRSLADIAPREQLLAELAGLFAAPMQQFASLLGATQRDVASLLDALINKRGGAPESSADSADQTPAAEAADQTPAAEAAADPTES